MPRATAPAAVRARPRDKDIEALGTRAPTHAATTAPVRVRMYGRVSATFRPVSKRGIVTKRRRGVTDNERRREGRGDDMMMIGGGSVLVGSVLVV